MWRGSENPFAQNLFDPLCHAAPQAASRSSHSCKLLGESTQMQVPACCHIARSNTRPLSQNRAARQVNREHVMASAALLHAPFLTVTKAYEDGGDEQRRTNEPLF